jgi:hypothetical protein|tara:strand:+ start:743 stop:934 length:192 start_codon:yes stop_codon:yes gene_type:complete
MTKPEYRVRQRTAQGLESRWGLWSGEQQCWIDVSFNTQAEAVETLAYLLGDGGRSETSGRESR